MKEKAIDVHIVPHTHWDKEWYFTASRSKAYLMRHVQEVIQLLISKPEYPAYLLDGQTSLIEDYLQYYPEDREKVAELIRNKRLLIGPWYTQTDQLVISAESIVRNLYYGMKDAEKLGYSMKIAYCPDVFGQGANMPQIYQHFGLNGFVFWRGIADDRLKQLEFLWQGSDGTKILANQMFFAYYYGLNMPKNPEILPDYIESVMRPLQERSVSGTLYFPCGGDQAPVQKDLPEVVKQMNRIDKERHYQLSSPDQFFEALELQEIELPVIQGEMIEGKNSRIHKSIYSTRADLKQMNNRIENKLTNILEPILSISHSLGNRYPHKEVEEIWKLMFENAAHDSIGGCNSDETNQDIKARYKLAEDLVDNLLDLHMREIAMATKQNEKYAITVFNTLPYSTNRVLDTYLYLPDGDYAIVDENGQEIPFTILSQVDHTDYLLNQFAYLTPHLYRQEMAEQYIPEKAYYSHVQMNVPDVPAMGYRQIYLVPGKAASKKSAVEIQKNTQMIENEFYQVTYCQEKQTFSVLDKESGHLYQNQFELVENGDDGDSYNYSPPHEDMVIFSSKEAQKIEIQTSKTALSEELTLSLVLPVPSDLEKRAQNIKDAEMPIVQKIELRKGEKIVRVTVECENHVESHRLCVKCATDIMPKYSICDRLFGVEKAELVHRSIDSWQEDGWTEAPIAINPMESFVAVENEERTVALMTEGVREYELVGEDFGEIQLTLFRTFGWMGKENLVYRPGRASGEKIVPTPDAQLIGDLHFEVAAVYATGTFDENQIAKASKEYLTPLQQYPLSDFLNGRTIFKKNEMKKDLPTRYSLMNLADSSLLLSTVKKAEVGDNLIYRVFNPFLKREISAESVMEDTPVMLDEMTLMEKKEQFGHNEFQTYVKKI